MVLPHALRRAAHAMGIDVASHDVIAVANYFIERGKREGNHVNPMKLQKLLYMAFGWYGAFFERRMFSSPIRAWSYGPVVPRVYHEVKAYGNGPITSPITRRVLGEMLLSFDLYVPRVKLTTPEETKFMDDLWKVMSEFNAVQLAALVNATGSPWHDLNELYHGAIPEGHPLKTADIHAFFEKLMEDALAFLDKREDG